MTSAFTYKFETLFVLFRLLFFSSKSDPCKSESDLRLTNLFPVNGDLRTQTGKINNISPIHVSLIKVGRMIFVNTGLPHYNSPHYNTDFSVTRSCLGSQMVIFLLF